jgi:hypothetical protein
MQFRTEQEESMKRDFRPLFATACLFSGVVYAQKSEAQGNSVALADNKKPAQAQQPAAAPQPGQAAQQQNPAPQAQAANAIADIRPQQNVSNIGFGVGFGFNPHPTSRFELDLLFNDPQILTISFEASTFSNKHFVAKSLLIDNYERNVKRRRLSLMYRNFFTSNLYYTVGMGLENYVASMLGPVALYSREYRSIITGVRQGYSLTLGMGQSFKSGPINLRIEWFGFSFLKKSRDITFYNDDPASTPEKIEETKNKLKKDTPESVRLMNTTISFEF